MGSDGPGATAANGIVASLAGVGPAASARVFVAIGRLAAVPSSKPRAIAVADMLYGCAASVLALEKGLPGRGHSATRLPAKCHAHWLRCTASHCEFGACLSVQNARPVLVW